MGVRKVSNRRSDLGYWQGCHSIGHIGFPIKCSIATTSMPLSCIVNEIFTYFPKFTEVKWLNISLLVVVYHSCMSTPLYLSACGNWSAELHRFQNYKRITWPWPRPLQGSLSSQGWHLKYSTYSTGIQICNSTWCILPAYKIWRLNLAVLEIWLQLSKLKMGHLILTMPLLWAVCYPSARTWYSLHVYKIWLLWLQPF